MKSLILIFALIFIAQNTMATSPAYKTLSATVIKNSQLIQDLRDLGADYVVQKGVFHPKKNALPGSYYEITKTEKVERSITPIATYYRYTVILAEYDNLAVIRASYVVTYAPNTGAVSVGSDSYRIIGGDPTGEQSVGGPSLVDVEPLNDDTDEELSPLLESSVAYTVKDAIAKKLIPKGKYQIGQVYNAYLADSGFPPTYVFLLTLVDAHGNTYRAEITSYSLDGSEQGDEWLPEYVIFPNA